MRIAVVSPFVDRQHGTERCLIEQLERAPDDAEMHVYSQRVQDLRGIHKYKSGTPVASGTQMLWHKVVKFPGPHLFGYIWWFGANKMCRWWDAHFRNLRSELIYSPGINALDADAVTVHIVFHEFHRRVISQLALRKTAISSWPRLIHRRLYYRLIMALEKKVYSNPRVSLAAVSSLVAEQLLEYFQRRDVRIIRNGVDTEELSPPRRLKLRSSAREKFSLQEQDFALLLIGNDWKKKGLDGLLRALAEIQELPWKLLVVGCDDPSPYLPSVRDEKLLNRVTFLQPATEVLQFYAAADVYVGPSLEDAYGLPVLEAMACGLPVIASCRAGVSEIIQNGRNGIVLSNPEDFREIAAALRSVIIDGELSRALGQQACESAQRHTWASNAQATWEWLCQVLEEKKGAERGSH